MSNEEIDLYNKIKSLKDSHDKLYVIYEELEELMQKNFKGSFTDKDALGLISSYNEFKKWRENKKE